MWPSMIKGYLPDNLLFSANRIMEAMEGHNDFSIHFIDQERATTAKDMVDTVIDILSREPVELMRFGDDNS